MNRIEQLAVQTALAHMITKGWMDICTIDKAIKSIGCTPDAEAYRALHLLHCVHFKDMPSELRAAIPELIAKVLGGDPIELHLPASEPAPSRTYSEPAAPAKPGLLRMLTGGARR